MQIHKYKRNKNIKVGPNYYSKLIDQNKSNFKKLYKTLRFSFARKLNKLTASAVVIVVVGKHEQYKPEILICNNAQFTSVQF